MIKLLSVLLLIATMLTGCGTAVEVETTGSAETAAPEATKEILENKEEPHESVAPELENFFKPTEDKGWVELDNATRLEGALVSRSTDGKVAVFRNADVDTMGNVTEIFTVYNAALAKTVLTLTNSYKLGNYDEFDWDNLEIKNDAVKYPSSAMKVVVYDAFGAVDVIKVSKAKVTEIAEDVREKNDDACVYDLAVTYDFYDVTGKHIVNTTDSDVERAPYGGFVIGNVSVVFADETDEAVRISNYDTEKTYNNYNYENEKYGYYLTEEYIEVYSKNSGNCILRYDTLLGHVTSSVACPDRMFVLEDGDILIQNVLPAKYKDVPTEVDTHGERYNVDHYILDVETGLLHPIALDFIITELYAADDAAEYVTGFALTEHVVNLASIRYIENKELSAPVVAVLDNDMSVMFNTGIIIPEHDDYPGSAFSDFGIEMLANGDYLVTLHDVVAEKAIVTKDGKIRAYLPDDAVVTDKYVATSRGIYDYDMNMKYSFEDEGYKFVTVFGDKFLVYDEYDAWDDVGNPITNYEYHLIAEDENMDLVSWSYMYDIVTVADGAESYMVTVTSDRKYHLYNTDYQCVLTTANKMTVHEIDGKYIVYTHYVVDSVDYPVVYIVD